MRPAALLTAVAGIAIVMGMLMAGRERFSGPDASAVASEAAAPDAGGDDAPPPPPTADPQASMNARPVDDASQFYPAQVEGKPLERVAPPEPEKPKPEPKKDAVLPRPVAETTKSFL